ncbi:MAG: proton-conducting transporter membrane subunit [Gemmatimonadota bacterium]|nr:proton-conducting transporter membrane subunit [Gemmatimonadota bacterium]MDH3422153.1 proton-conducting transporter membrane subunit [Gemmatimonadota bacterium]
MSWIDLLPPFILASSLIPGVMIFLLPESRHDLRTTLNMASAVVKVVAVGMLLAVVAGGRTPEWRWPLVPGVELLLQADELSLLFVTLSAGLWLVTTVYAVAYLEGSPQRSRFFGFFSLCVSATVGIALAGNLFTFLFFYEILTITTYPLLVHRGTRRALAAGGRYLAYTLSGGALLLVGTAWLFALAGPVDFVPGGGAIDELSRTRPTELRLIFALLVGGLGVKAAIVPLHGWLPVAMIAPAPVSALLHAVAVVKAGVFGIVRVVYSVYGVEAAGELGVLPWLAAFATATILFGSLRALVQDNLKRRLAYSTVSQLSYITLGVALANPLAFTGAIVHLVHQGLMKITLFFCAGNLAETLEVHRVSEMRGVGRRMPWTMGAFTISALGMVGVPPVAGFVSKWYLGAGALQAGHGWVVAVLVVSGLLNAAYFLPILKTAWIDTPARPWPERPEGRRLETAWMLLFPTLVTALLSLLVGLLAAAPFSPLAWAHRIALTVFAP